MHVHIWSAILIIMDTYVKPVSAKFDSWRMNIMTPVSRPVISFLEASQLPGEYAAHAAKCVAQRA